MSDTVVGVDKEGVNRWMRYHSEIAFELTSQRTALESALIPVTAYILVACVECYRRYPEMIEAIADACRPRRSAAPAIDSRTRSTPCACGLFRTSH